MTERRRTSNHPDRPPTNAQRLRPAASAGPDIHDREARYLLERAELKRRRERSAKRGQRPLR
jgi:hypothetical protein